MPPKRKLTTATNPKPPPTPIPTRKSETLTTKSTTNSNSNSKSPIPIPPATPTPTPTPAPAPTPSPTTTTTTSINVEASNSEATAAATKPTTKKVRKIIKKVIIKRILPKGTLAARKKAAEEAASSKSNETLVNKPETEKRISATIAPKEEIVTACAEEVGLTERQKRRRTEIFVGGLDKEAKEEDVRKVFEKAGEVVEVRMMMDSQSGKNKGYCFLRYKDPAVAKKAITDFAKVEICGKLCGAAAAEGNDRIFLGNIDKKWREEDIIKLLKEIGVENIDAVTLVADPQNPGYNRGFAFLELQTNRDAQYAYKKLTKKDVFGKGRNIKVSWAEPFNDPDEEEMQKVKSIFVEGIPNSWDQAKLAETFKKYGKIERVVLSRDIRTAKRKDFAFVNYTTREAAHLCLESFGKEELSDNGKKVNVKVSLAKPVQKGKQDKGGQKSSGSEKERHKIVESEIIPGPSSRKVLPFKANQTMRDKKSSTTNELLHVLREQAAWKQGHPSYATGAATQEYESRGKRAFSAMADDSMYYDVRGYHRPRIDINSYLTATPSYSRLAHDSVASSQPYYESHSVRYPTGYYEMDEIPHTTPPTQIRRADPYLPSSRPYPRY